MSQPSSENVSQTGTRALAAYLSTYVLSTETKDKIAQQIAGFGRAVLFTDFGDDDPVIVFNAYAAKVEEFAIPKADSMIDAIRVHCFKAREVWLTTLFQNWTVKLGTLGKLDHDEAVEVIQAVGVQITELPHEDLIIVMKENERHGLGTLIRYATLVHQFDGSPQLADTVAHRLGVLTIVEPMSAVFQPQTTGNGADQTADVEVGDAVSATTGQD